MSRVLFTDRRRLAARIFGRVSSAGSSTIPVKSSGLGSAANKVFHGYSLASAEPFAYALCLALMGLVFAVPLWRRKLTTLADLYRQRFSSSVERLAAHPKVVAIGWYWGFGGYCAISAGVAATSASPPLASSAAEKATLPRRHFVTLFWFTASLPLRRA